MKALKFLKLLAYNFGVFMIILFIDICHKLHNNEIPLWFKIIGLISAVLFLSQILIGMFLGKKIIK